MRTRLTTLLAGAIIAFASVFAGAASGLAQPAEPGGADSVSPMSIGDDVYVTATRTLFQCPGSQCNQGQAYVGNDMRLVCKLDNSTNWVLAMNRTNSHVGWISRNLLGGISREPALCYGSGKGTSVFYNPTPLYQCQSVSCNQGQAYLAHDVAILCVTTATYDFAINQTNKHVGWIDFRQYPGVTDVPTC